MPTRRQAISWTNYDPVHRRIYAALGGDALNVLSSVCHQPAQIGAKFHMKQGPSQYKDAVLLICDPQCKDKTLSRPCYLYNWNPIPEKTVFMFRRGPESLWSNLPEIHVSIHHITQRSYLCKVIDIIVVTVLLSGIFGMHIRGEVLQKSNHFPTRNHGENGHIHTSSGN